MRVSLGGGKNDPMDDSSDCKLNLRKLKFCRDSVPPLLRSETAINAKEVALYMCKIIPGHEESVWNEFAAYFQRNKQLESLELATDLIHSFHNQDTSILLIRAAVNTSTLRRLKIHFYSSGHGEELQDYCQQLVANNPLLESLSVLLPQRASSVTKIGLSLKGCSRLHTLDFSNMGMGDVAFTSFADTACTCLNLRQSLKSLAISRNQLSSASLVHLTNLIKHLSCLHTFDVCGNGGLFRLPHNQGVHKSRAFMQALTEHQHLSTLLIRACSIKNNEARMLFDGLTHNRSIECLDLDYNLIEIDGIMHLAKTLAHMKCLRVLEMDDLELVQQESPTMVTDPMEEDTYDIVGWGKREKEAFMEALGSNFSLCRFEIDVRLFPSDEEAKVANSILHGNHVLQSLQRSLHASERDPGMWQVCLERSGSLLRGEPRRQATALYSILQRKEW